MPIGNLTAFLQYLMQILFSVLMAVIMFVFVPRAAVSAERIQEVLDTEPSIADPESRSPIAPFAAGPAGPGRVPRRRVPLPGRRAAGPARHLVHGAARPDDGDRRQHRQRQVDAGQPHPALLRRHRGRGRGRRRRRPRPCARRTCGSGSASSRSARSCSVARSPATFATALPTPPTRSCGTRSRSPRRGVRRRDARRARRARSTRAARTSPAASASGWRSPGRSSSAPEVYIFDDSFSALDFKTDSQLRAALARRDPLGRP